jgi:hypothetical protein
MVIVEKLVERRLEGETEVLGENLPHCHFVHHKSHMTRPGFDIYLNCIAKNYLEEILSSCILRFCDLSIYYLCAYHIYGSWDSAVGIATGYRLNDRGVGIRVPVW